jgi:hypothetical protein
MHLPRVLQGLGLPKGLFGGCENIHAVGGLVVESSVLTEAIRVPTVATPANPPCEMRFSRSTLPDVSCRIKTEQDVARCLPSDNADRHP